MLDYMAGNLANIIAGTLVFASVGLAVGKMVGNRKNHVRSCSGCSGCAGCPKSGTCSLNSFSQKEPPRQVPERNSDH